MAYFLNPGFVGRSGEIYFEMGLDWPIDRGMEGLPIPKSAVRAPFRIITNHTKVPDFIRFDAFYCGVSGAALCFMKNFSATDVEGIEIEILDKKGRMLVGDYYLLNVLTFRKGAVLNDANCRTTQLERRMPDGSIEFDTITDIYMEKLKIRRGAFQGVHIWHEEYDLKRRRSDLFGSDALVDGAKLKKLTGFDSAVRIEEI